MNKINVKNIKNKDVKSLVKKIMKEHNLKRIKLAIRVGGGNPDFIFSKKSRDHYSDGRSFFWDETIRIYDTDSEYQYYKAVMLWKEFFKEVSCFDKYRIEEVVIYR